MDIKHLPNFVVWSFKKSKNLNQISSDEIKIAKSLGKEKAFEFTASRAAIRLALSKIFEIDKLKVPLFALLGEAPKLSKGLGNVSLSHTKDQILIGWSKFDIGVDIERKDRYFEYSQLSKRFYKKEELKYLERFKESEKKIEILKYWIMKESCLKCQRGKNIMELFDYEWDKEKNYCISKKKDTKFHFEIIEFKEFLIGISLNTNIKIIPKTNKLKINNSFLKNIVCYG